MAEISPHSGIIKDGEHISIFRVYYEDTDAGGIVYHANYLKFMERGRSDMLRLMEIDQVEMLKFQQQDDFKFVVVRTEVDYIMSAKLEDEIAIHTRVIKLGRASVILGQEIYRDDDILARGKIRVAILNADERPTRLSQNVVNRLHELITE